jgi:hypothetical protein
MRAATVIVGAIAAASILIALAFILSPRGGSSASGTTTVVRKVVEASAPATEESSASEAGAREATGGVGGPKPCGGDEFSVEGTSCQVGAQIHEDYEGGRRGDLFAKDETGATLTFLCKDETVPITCTGEEGGVVYFGG